MGAEKNKGLAYYCYMFCAENRQILAIVDRLKVGVNSLQRHSNDAYINRLVRHSRGTSFKAVSTNLWSINNRQNLAILCTKHATVVRQTLIFLRPHIKRKAVWPCEAILFLCFVFTHFARAFVGHVDQKYQS